MSNPLPVQEIRDIIGDHGFLRLYGQDAFLFVSDLPRRVSDIKLSGIRQSLRECGFETRVDTAGLLLIDLRLERWQALLNTFQSAAAVHFPPNDALHGVYALARLLERHPAAFEQQPMELVRAVFKRYGVKNGLPRLAPLLHARCALRLRQGKPLPSALKNVLYVWLAKQV